MQFINKSSTTTSAGSQTNYALSILPPLVIATVTFAISLACILTRPTGLLASCWLTNAFVVGLMLRQPRFAVMSCWIAVAIGFFGADFVAGSSWMRTALLTGGNLAGMIVAHALFLRMSDVDRGFQRPRSVIYFLMILTAASTASGLVGIFINPFLFHGGAVDGFAFWFVTEFVNYMTILPIMLTFSGLRNFMSGWLSAQNTLFASAAPLIAFVLSLIAGLVIDGPGALVFPIPALLWCAISYDIAKTTFLTFCFGFWSMLAVFTGDLNLGIVLESRADFISLRLGILLVALGPLTVASVTSALSRALREAAAARAAAERARDSRSLLLATMSHELRAPLSSVVGYANLIADQLLGPVGNPDYSEFARTIEKNGHYLKDLVNDLLDITQIDTQERKLVFEAIASHALVEQSLRLIKGMAFERRVSLEMDSSPDWPSVKVDSKAIKQIMINLLSNAIKFSPQGGRILIYKEVNANRLIIKIKDHGPGISAENLALLGRPYVRLQTAAEESKFESTGLGLSVCHKLIDQHGGRLRLESAVGLGTTALFDLPLV